MLERLNDLSFVIGIFFTIVALILFGNMLINDSADAISVYTASAFLIFGVAMMFPYKKKK